MAETIVERIREIEENTREHKFTQKKEAKGATKQKSRPSL